MASAPFHGFVKALSAEELISLVIKEFIVLTVTSAAVVPVFVRVAT